MEVPTPPTLSVRKRYCFSYEDDPDKEKAPKQKKVRFPKGKKTTAGEDPARNLRVIDGEEDEGPIIHSADPRIAAKERALKRDSTTDQLREEDTGVLADVTKAEEEYEQDEEELVEDGQRFEPVNLKQEREEGYFDAQGNYVEYRNENEGKDAWLESVEVDTRFAAKAIAENEKIAEDEKEDNNLGREELWAIKQRIADALQPGETVLRALRRLKGTPREGGRREKMSEANKAIFDQLAEDAVKLLDDGDYNVYEETRETFQREAEGYAAVARLRAGITSDSVARSSQTGDGTDIFGDDEDGTEQAGPTNQNSAVAAAAVKADGKDVQDMFGDDDDVTPASASNVSNGDGAQEVAAPSSEGAAPVDGSGYVYDESSGTDVGEAQLIDETEDDAPLSAFIDPTLTGKRNKTGHVTNAKNGETVTKATAEKSSASAGLGTSVKKETPSSVEVQPAAVVGPANSSPEKSAPVKRRVSILKKGKPKGQHVLGRFKEPSETKAKKANGIKSGGLVEREPKKKQESGQIKRKVRFVEEEPSGEKVSVNASRFKNARNTINELLLVRIPGSYPVSEAACAEVEFAQELAASTASDLKKVCEEIQPAVKQFYRRDGSSSEEVPAPRSAEEKWIDARCKHLRNSLSFHYSIVRHLAVPTFALCNIEDVPPSAE